MEENLAATLAVFARARGQTCQRPGVFIASSAVDFAMFNSAVLTTPVADASELNTRVKAAAEYYSECRLPWSFWVCDGWIEAEARSRIGAVCEANGLHLVLEMPGMESSVLLPARRRLPEIECRPVNDRHSRIDFNHLMTVAFGIPFAISRQIYEAEQTWADGFSGWVGYADGLAVTSAATLVTPGVIGVYAVGTLPAYRRKGYGERIMRQAIHAASTASGVEHSVLQSSAAGYRLYVRMGYSVTTSYTIFARS